MARSRKGCNTCKRRHRKCDETKPFCQTCEAYGLQCEGYTVNLRWATSHVSSSPYSTTKRQIKPAVEHRILEPNDRCSRQPILTAASNGASRPRSRPRPAANALARSSMSNLRNDVCTSLQSPESDNEVQTLDLLLKECESLILRKACLSRDQGALTDGFISSNSDADKGEPNSYERYGIQPTSDTLRAIIAAMHLYLSNPEAPGPGFQDYSTRAMHLFRCQLDHYDGSLDAGILAAGLLICTLNLFQSLPWSPTLKHMIKVFGIGRSTLPNLSDPLCHPITRSTIEAMGVMDLPANVRGRTPRSFGIWRDVRASQTGFSEAGGSVSDRVELISALPRTLLDLLARIEDADAEAAFLAWPGEVGEIPQLHHWEAYRLAGILNCRRYNRAKVGAGWGNDKHPAQEAPAGPSNDVLVARIVAHLDALLESSGRPVYSNYLTLNAIFFPYAAARLEVAVLLRHGHLMDTLRRIKAAVHAYAATENSRILEEMLNQAYEAGDDYYDLDEECRRRGVEISLF